MPRGRGAHETQRPRSVPCDVHLHRDDADILPDSSGGYLRKSNFLRRVFKPLLRRAGARDVTFHSLRHSANSFLIEEGADPLLIASINGWTDIRMVYDHYGHLFERRRDEAAQAMDRTFGDFELGGQIVVKNRKSVGKSKTPIPKSVVKSAFQVVEVSGLEPLTPYMRSKCSTS